ncbi:MAG: hypothetical protein M9918_13385 [Anaerolineae bacterium]|nr:hypothetical protein [Anaerolineae bacterium]
MNQATFNVHQVIYENGKPVFDENGRYKLEVVSKTHKLPPGWEFKDLDEIEHAQVLKFEKLFNKALKRYAETDQIEVSLENGTSELFYDTVVNAAIEAGFFESVPEKKGLRDYQPAARFVDAFKTDINILPENLF